MPRAQKWVAFTLALLFGLTSGLESIEAQRSRSGFSRFFGGGGGGSGRGDGSLMSVVRQESAQTELGIKEDQKKKIEDLRDRSRQFPPELTDLYSKRRDASEEERAVISAKIDEIRGAQRKKTEAELKLLVTPQQFTRLQQLSLHAQGIQALRKDEVADDMKLDAAQKEKIKAIYDDIQKQQSEIFASMRDLPREERGQAFAAFGQKREKMQKEAEQKVIGLLTDTQKQAWQTKLGPPPVALAQNDDQPKPAATAPAKPAAEPTVEKPATNGSTTVKADGTEEKKEVVASFGDDKSGAKDGKPERLSFNFQSYPWGDLLKLFAESAGLTLELKDTPPGTWTYFDKNKYTPIEALDVLNGALLQRGFIMVKRDEALVVMSVDNDIPPNLIPNVRVSELESRGKNELMTIILPMDAVDAAGAAEEVKELLGPQGKVVALPKTNRMVVTDIGKTLIRIRDLFPELEPEGDRIFKAFPLKHIAAEDAEDIVRDLFGLSARGVQNVSQSGSGASSSSFGSRFGSSRFGSSRFQDPRFASRTPSRTPTSTSGSSRQPNNGTEDNKVNVSIDPRTNSLLVTATPAEMKIVEQSMKAVDVEAKKGPNDFARRNNEPYLEVYQLNSADAVEVAKTLNVLYPGAVVNEDGRARRLHIFGTPDLHKEIANVIRRLDGEGGGSTVAVVPLGRIDSYTATATLQSLFIADRENAPTIQPHPVGNALLVRGSSDQVTQIKTLIAQMIPQGVALGGGTVRTLNLNGRTAEDFVEVLEKMWNARESNPIRVVLPSNRGPIRDRRIPSQGSSLRPERYEETQPPSPPKKSKKTPDPDTRTKLDTPTTEKKDVFASVSPVEKARTIPVSTALDQTVALNQAEKASAELLPKAPTKQQSPIVITINGGNLVIASEDEEALDRLEEMFQQLAQALPIRQTWTVFYLSSADVTDTATLLERLFPTSSVSTGTTSSGGGLFGDFTGGLSSMGRGLMDMSGLSTLGTGPLTLRIIPNTRTNSLFVSGPAGKVQEVADMLEVLDESDPPGQLRDRAPRNIEVEHANVADVAEIVKDVYKDYMQGASQQQNGNGQNPFAMLMGNRGGGRSGSRGNSQQREIRMTLGVDTRTNMLIVSASDSLFRQVQTLVRSLDDAALVANRTVQVQKLKNVNSVVVQEALQSLLPRVSVSTTGQSGPTTSSSSRSGSQGRPSGGGSDQMRQFMEQRMRERMMQQRGGQPGSNSNRGSSGFNRGSSSRRSSGFRSGSSRSGSSGRDFRSFFDRSRR